MAILAALVADEEFYRRVTASVDDNRVGPARGVTGNDTGGTKHAD
jgi:hypothetical protein